MSQLRLSDRIIESAQKLLTKCLEHPLVTQLLMNGSGDNPMAVLAHYCKAGLDIIDIWPQIFRIAANKTDNQKEKELLESIANGFSDSWNKWLEAYNEEFGPLDSEFASQPMAQTVWLYRQHLLKEALFGDIVDLLVAILPSFYGLLEVNRFVESNDNFEPNVYFKYLSFSGFDLDKSVDLLKSLIDERENEVSDEHLTRLIELFKRSLVNEKLFLDSAINQEKWIE